MLSLFIIVTLITFNAAMCYETVPLILFKIQSERVNDQSIFTCDHSRDKVLAQQISTHTVFEGRTFRIISDYNGTIDEILCYALNNESFYLSSVDEHNMDKRCSEFIAEKSMGTQWKCTILAHLDNAVIQPVVQYKSHNYSAVYCYMGIHVRQKVAPQTILVNNMELPAVRTGLSQKDVDFFAEYQYEDGDIVNVTCINEWSDKMLTMEYKMAGTKSDESTMNDLSSNKMIGFVTKLHSGHNNSYIICTHTEADDYTKVMVKFVKRTSFNNIVFLKINGMFVRPHLVNPRNNQYRIDYKYVSDQLINVTCEVERTDVQLLVLYRDIDTLELLINVNRKSEMSFYPSSKNKHLECATGYLNGTTAETVAIHFTEGISLAEQYPLHHELETNGRVMMEVYNDYKLHVMFIEFVDGEKVKILCRMCYIPVVIPGPILFLQLDSATCNQSGCSTNIGFTATRKYENAEKTCYLKHKPDIVRREIRMIFRERVLTNETTTLSINSSNNNTLIYCLSGVVVIVTILVVLYYTIIKKRCCVRSRAPIPAPRIDPASVFYENQLAVFQPINEREAAEMEEDHYEDIE